ncbi:hypothetical protein CRV08_06075 [Halarcobacter ebronensis]|uniref:Uncharacterized protein n=1 Tax=Halarcobacter ebronensis TaxID=1462615 RepID=A0A4Q0YEM7_9BACT|nr:hypothetical protein [Halarcobacter ebronensis]RXJ68996.1 hypothetical protein CRV08_06075 [Halarcobacter ebronensis]
MKVRVILDTNNKLNEITTEALKLYNKKNSDSFLTFEYKENIPIEKIYNYTLLNELLAIYKKYQDSDDYIIILNQDSTILDFEKILTTLYELNFQETIFAFRVSNVNGIGLKYSPRVPFVDDSIICLNILKAKEKSFFNRELIKGVHFFKYGRNHALLQSFIEYSMQSGEFINFYNEKSIVNEYNKFSKLFPLPFSFCKKSSVICADLSYNKRYFNLIEDNLNNISFGNETTFFKENIIKRILKVLLEKINRSFQKIQNREFQKKYDEK